MAGRLFRTIEGVNMPRFFSEKCFRSALNFEPKQGDIVIATYPKCGTTWMQNLVLNILRMGEPLANPLDFFLASPFLDQLGAEESEERMIRPGAYKTHLPLQKIHWSEAAKYIYVARNPKDSCVSYYHHVTKIGPYEYDSSMDDFVDLFVSGQVDYGSYFDNVLPWYAVRHKPNVFFTTYEDMQKDLRAVALRLSEFIDEGLFGFLSARPGVLGDILHNCSYEVMKSDLNTAMTSLYQLDRDQIKSLPEGRRHILEFNFSLATKKPTTHAVVRQGKVGSHKSEFTENQNKVLDAFIKENTKDSDLMDLWKDVQDY